MYSTIQSTILNSYLNIVFGKTVASGNNSQKEHRFVMDRWMGHAPKLADEGQVSNSKNAQTLNAQIILTLSIILIFFLGKIEFFS